MKLYALLLTLAWLSVIGGYELLAFYGRKRRQLRLSRERRELTEPARNAEWN